MLSCGYNNMNKRWMIIVSIAGAIAVCATGLYTLRVANQEPKSTTTPTEESQPPAKITAVTALGRIEPKGEVIKLSPPPDLGGAKIKQLLIKEGERVRSNQLIAVLDNRPRRLADLERSEKELKVARANLAIVKAGAKTGEINAQRATIERLQAQLRGEIATNQAIIARLEAQLRGEQREQKATITRLEAELDNAQTEFERYRKLEKDGAISESDLDQRRLTLDTARERVKEAQATLRRTIETLREEIRETKALNRQTVNTLDKEIKEAIATLNQIAEIRPVDVEQAAAEVERAIASIKQSQEELELSYVRAPISGQILKIYSLPGETVNEEEGIADFAQTDNMMVIAEVYESDIGKIKLGQKAIITSETGAFEQELQGIVSQIGLQIGQQDILDTDPAADVDVRVVEVKIELNSEDSEAVAGLTYSKVLAKISL